MTLDGIPARRASAASPASVSQQPDRPAATGLAVRVDEGVPGLARVAGSSQHWLPVVDDSRADPGFTRDVDEMGHPGTDSAPVLGESAEVGLVGDEDRVAKPQSRMRASRRGQRSSSRGWGRAGRSRRIAG